LSAIEHGNCIEMLPSQFWYRSHLSNIMVQLQCQTFSFALWKEKCCSKSWL